MNFILLGICIVAGVVLRLSGILPENSHRGVNAWVLYVAMPAVALLYIPAIEWSIALVLPVVTPLIVWMGAWLTVKFFAGPLNRDKHTGTALLLTAGLGNTSFLGFPLTQAYFGDRGLHIAVICDQISFITLSTLGVITAVRASHGAGSGWNPILKHIIRFPPFLAFLAALIIPRFADYSIINPILEKLAATLVPLALFSVGLQIQSSEWKDEWPPLALGLTYKMLLAPALVFCAALAFRMEGVIAQASVFEAAMPPMITSAILASEHGLNPRLSNLMASIGIVLALATTGFWYLILRTL